MSGCDARAAEQIARSGRFTLADGVIRDHGITLVPFKAEGRQLYFALLPGYGFVAGDSWQSLQWHVSNAIAWVKEQEKQEKRGA